MSRFLARATAALDEILMIGRPPPFSPALAISSVGYDQPSSSHSTISDLVRDMSILWGVPKTRTTKPTKWTRKHSVSRILTPITGITTCPECGSKHLEETLCGTCYEKVRQVTNEIKEKMMAYNPYKGERQDKEVFLRFSGEEQADEEVVNGKRIIELERPRPSWFKRIFPEK